MFQVRKLQGASSPARNVVPAFLRQCGNVDQHRNEPFVPAAGTVASRTSPLSDRMLVLSMSRAPSRPNQIAYIFFLRVTVAFFWRSSFPRCLSTIRTLHHHHPISNMASTSTLPQLPHIPNTDPVRAPLDLFRTAVAVQLHRAIPSIPLEKCYEGVEGQKKENDFNVAIPPLSAGRKARPMDQAGRRLVHTRRISRIRDCIFAIHFFPSPHINTRSTSSDHCRPRDQPRVYWQARIWDE